MTKIAPSSPAWRHRVRAALPAVLGALPRLRGLGRLVLAVDSFLTDASDPASYRCAGRVNGRGRLQLDLRAWGQKFAFYYREWEGDLVAMMRRLYRGGTFIDVGSSLGLYVVGLGADVVARGGRILSFEPIPFNCERQRENIALNRLERVVRLERLALGEATGILRLSADPAQADNNAFASPTGQFEVDVRRLDDVLAESPRLPPVTLMKLDVEGFEPFVLRGARAVLERWRPAILAEFHRERMAMYGVSMQESWDLLRSLGYGCHRIRRGRLERLPSPGAIENLFFLPPRRVVGTQSAEQSPSE